MLSAMKPLRETDCEDMDDIRNAGRQRDRSPTYNQRSGYTFMHECPQLKDFVSFHQGVPLEFCFFLEKS